MHAPTKHKSEPPRRAPKCSRRLLIPKALRRVPVIRQSPDFLEILERILPVPARMMLG